ncbi:FAD-dependent oxidoreductase [Nocardioides limicola]|uniref:FAD-dependent oxidoreductase n=1 Tax=Nocardioides limicola TaxID=2803368 RepID=UPI00193B83E2|nr:FAD-dependent oxidoreductase [Nocardioides sp. DJM-14]
MSYVVTQSCCADASCVVACPVNCIHPTPGEPGFAEAEMLYIDPASCVGCGACTTACPVGAILPTSALSPGQEPFRLLNAEYYDTFELPDRTPLALVPTQRRLARPGPFRVAIVGAGPAGLYTADELLKHPEIERVDVYDRLLTPYGLVRHGVAPDHAATKKVTRLFEAIERDPRFGYVLGIEIGRDLTVAELRERYHAVVFAVGATTDRRLDIPGEQLPGSLSATDVVRWYNGHPDLAGLEVPLDSERAVVIGNGNVALDVARILTLPPAALTATDMAPAPLEALRRSQVREVVVIGRRGPAEAAFTMPELIGLAGLDDIDVRVDLAPESITGNDQRSRLVRELATRAPRPDRRRIVLRFAASPVEVLGGDRVSGVRLVENRLVTDADGVLRAEPTTTTSDLDAGLVIRSIGHRGLRVAGLPWDEKSGTVPHRRGRVEAGAYVVGWIKRGPTGSIGTNKSCAQETVASILDDLDRGVPALVEGDAADLVRSRQREVVGLAEWRRLDREELARGMAVDRPRLKITDVAEQRRVAAAPTTRLQRARTPRPATLIAT